MYLYILLTITNNDLKYRMWEEYDLKADYNIDPNISNAVNEEVLQKLKLKEKSMNMNVWRNVKMYVFINTFDIKKQ